MAHKPIKATSKGGKDFELVPAGVHFAICTKVIGLGLQRSTYDGESREQEKVFIGFEVPEVLVDYKDGKAPAVIGRTFTLSIGEKSNLGPFLENWRNKKFTDEQREEGFDITSIIGKICNLGVVHTEPPGKIYANISSAGALMKIQLDALAAGTLSGTPYGNLLVYNPEDHDEAVFSQLPKFLKDKIATRVKPDDRPVASPATAKAAHEDFNDDIPF